MNGLEVTRQPFPVACNEHFSLKTFPYLNRTFQLHINNWCSLSQWVSIGFTKSNGILKHFHLICDYIREKKKTTDNSEKKICEKKVHLISHHRDFSFLGCISYHSSAGGLIVDAFALEPALCSFNSTKLFLLIIL